MFHFKLNYMKNLIFTLGLAILGILMPRISLADDNIPKADILDVVFNEDGTAYDASPMDNTVEVIGKEMMTTYYNENYKYPDCPTPGAVTEQPTTRWTTKTIRHSGMPLPTDTRLKSL